MPDADNNYFVDILGFNETERRLLASIFGLAARHDPSFRQRDPASKAPVDLYLVDADNVEAMKVFQLVRARNPAPSVLIGESDHGTGSLLLGRPIQWARLLQAFGETVFDGVQQGSAHRPHNAEAAGPADHDKTLVLRRTATIPPYVSTSPPRAAVPESGAGNDAADYEKTMVLQRTPSTQPRVGAPPAPVAAPQQIRQAAPAAPANRAKKISDRVLVVDDNATVRHFMEVKLAPFGFGVDFAESGEEAIGLTAEKEYTCIFLDVVLPGIDGFQVCKLIKSNKQAIKRTAIVMLTGRTSTFDKVRGTLAGCNEYLTKPVDENRLLEVIAKFLPIPAATTV